MKSYAFPSPLQPTLPHMKPPLSWTLTVSGAGAQASIVDVTSWLVETLKMKAKCYSLRGLMMGIFMETLLKHCISYDNVFSVYIKNSNIMYVLHVYRQDPTQLVLLHITAEK